MQSEEITKKYVFESDPGHGWLGVPGKDVLELGVKDSISQYSYYNRKTDTFWLEEDCDASVFIDAAKKAGWSVSWTTKNVDHDSSIRSLPRVR